MSLLKKLEIPRQLPSPSEANIVSSLKDQTLAIGSGVSGVSFVLMFILSIAATMLWGMINAQQIMAYLPLFERLKFPANATEFSSVLIQIASFDLIPTYLFEEHIFYFPEDDPQSLNF